MTFYEAIRTLTLNVSEKACKINWKEPDKALTKVYPRETENEEVSEPGSFFNLFEYEGDPNEVNLSCATCLSLLIWQFIYRWA